MMLMQSPYLFLISHFPVYMSLFNKGTYESETKGIWYQGYSIKTLKH